MSNLNPGSLIKLEQCDKRLQRLFKELAKTEKFIVICGYRDHVEQDKAFNEGHSKVKWPNGKHNQFPSLAVDVAPIPLDWNDQDAFYKLGGLVMRLAEKLQIPVKWGATFTTLRDTGHFEIIDEENISVTMSQVS